MKIQLTLLLLLLLLLLLHGGRGRSKDSGSWLAEQLQFAPLYEASHTPSRGIGQKENYKKEED